MRKIADLMADVSDEDQAQALRQLILSFIKKEADKLEQLGLKTSAQRLRSITIEAT